VKAADIGNTPRLLVTPGEPAGIGPDILLQWAANAVTDFKGRVIAIADPGLLNDRAKLLGIPVAIHPVRNTAEACSGRLNILPVDLQVDSAPGRLDPRNAPYVLETLSQAARLCLAGEAEAITTGPVQKSVINEAGIPFSGHTEFFAEVCSVSEPVMMLATPGLRVALVTTHLPLRDVAEHITAAKIHHCLQTLHRVLQNDFAIARPHILVAGLNPHAGEEGHLGTEEKEIIRPVLESCRAEGMHISGPLPADTLFTAKYLETADAVLAMYHDQGLPVLKHAGFGRAVNITLGLPLIRTSVDHGTALDLAGSGRADDGSFAYALEVASQLASNRKKPISTEGYA